MDVGARREERSGDEQERAEKEQAHEAAVLGGHFGCSSMKRWTAIVISPFIGTPSLALSASSFSRRSMGMRRLNRARSGSPNCSDMFALLAEQHDVAQEVVALGAEC